MTKKQVFRSIAFCLVVCCLIVLLCDLFEQDDPNYASRFYSYRHFEEDTVDAVYFGTSGVDRYWISAKAYEEYGMTVYNLTCDGMPVWLYDIMIDEAFEYQTPELLIFDIRAFGQRNIPDFVDVRGRRTMDALGLLSWNRVRAAFRTMEIMHRVDENQPEFDISYLLPFVKFHTKWSSSPNATPQFTLDNTAGHDPSTTGGFVLHSHYSVHQAPQSPVNFDENYKVNYVEELDPISEEALYRVINYTKELGVEVLFVDTPQFMSDLELGRANKVIQILEEEGVPYISYNTPGASEALNVEFDLETDFYESNHTNYYGAEKFTASLAAYLDAHYDLPDHRGDADVQKDWNGVYDNIKQTIAQFEADKKAKEEKNAAAAAPNSEAPDADQTDDAATPENKKE